MPRRLRVATGGYAYHILNRGVGKMRRFAKERDFDALEAIIGQAKERLPMHVLAWRVMSTHWHFVLWPREDGDLSEFMRSADCNAHAAPARGASDGGNRPVVPGTLQAVPALQQG